jgi:WD40 repeat protein
MRSSPLALVLLLAGLATLSIASAQPSQPQPGADKKVIDEINRLVKQLGDDDFATRAEAKKRLETIGEPAIGILSKVAESAQDAEVRSAAKAIVEAFDVIRVFAGHRDRVNGVAVTADGKRALSASWDGALRLWDLENGQVIREMKGQNGPLMSVTFSRDGKRALTGSSDRKMRLWDVEAGAELSVFEHPQTVWDVVFSPDGKKALSGCSDGSARLWDLDSGKELLALETHKGGMAWSVAFVEGGKQAVTGGGSALTGNGAADGSLRLWDLATGQELRRFNGHTKDVRRLAISPDGKQLLSGSFDGTMRLWDFPSGKEIKRFEGPGNFVESVAFTPSGKTAICSYGPRVAEAIYDSDPRCSLRLWDLATGKELKQFKGHSAPILSLALSANGRVLVSGSADNTMRSWRLPK